MSAESFFRDEAQRRDFDNQFAVELMEAMTPRERAELDALLAADVPWEPFEGRPQELAYHCEADVLGYGGGAGGGKTDLLLGLASTAHKKSVIFRRELAQLEGLETRAHEMFDGKGRFNSTKHRWRLEDGRQIEFGGVEQEKDVGKWQGRPHDFKAFDELCYFSEYQFRYLSGWNRSSDAKQRKRVVAAFNPPTTAEGDWVINYFGPWLNKRHPRPALPGELRWFAMIDKEERECRNGLPFWWTPQDGGPKELIEPRSRTFIPARVEDNPILMASGYKATLQALPEPLRSLMLKGSFNTVQEDHPWQVIPTDWVEMAQARWKPRDPKKHPRMSQVGVDVARGGNDKTVYAPRFDNHFAKTTSKPGRATPDGQTIIKDVVTLPDFNGDTPVSIDAIAVGSSPVDIGRMFSVKIWAQVASGKSFARDKSKKLGFFNKRAEWIWSLREALDPRSGQDIELPPGRELLADLTAARYELTARGIKIEDKDEIKERIKRSPDEGEAVILAHAKPPGGVVHAGAIVSGQPLEIPG